MLNFANAKFETTQRLANAMASARGVEQIFSYSDKDLKNFTNFYQENYAILQNPRGCGYWLWKPFLIKELLNKITVDEVLMYCDSGVLLLADPSPLYDLCLHKEQIFFEMPGNPNRRWTKRDCFVALGCDSAEFWNRSQITGQCHLWKKSASSLERVESWLAFCKDPTLLTDSPSKAANLEGFEEHRHDQSILSLLVAKWGLEVFRDPSQKGDAYRTNFLNSSYDTLSVAVGNIADNECIMSQLGPEALAILKQSS